MNLDEELMLDAQEDAEAVAYIKRHLPQELQEKFSEEQLYYFLDVIIEYYTESGILDAEPDKEGFIEIDEEDIANYILFEKVLPDSNNFYCNTKLSDSSDIAKF